MKVTNQSILIIIVVLTLLSLPLITLTTGPWRIILGFLLLLLFPGYSLLSALFPGRNKLNSVERLALSFGLSCAIVVIIGLILNYTPWGIALSPILIAITLFTVLAAAIGWYRQQKLPLAERFGVSLCTHSLKWSETTRANRVITVVLIVVVLALIGWLIYSLMVAK